MYYDRLTGRRKERARVELSEESVMLKGNAEALNNITSIDVGPIDISGATDDISTSVDLTGYLPDGVL